MQWKLVHVDHDLGLAWRSYFHEAGDVEVIAGDICAVECDALVSPAYPRQFGEAQVRHFRLNPHEIDLWND